MITRRRDVAEKQVWDAGGEGKNVWDVGMPIIKTMGGGRQVKKSKRSKIVVGGGRREGGQKWHWEAGCRTKMKREAGCCTPVSPPLSKKLGSSASQKSALFTKILCNIF